MDQKSQNPAGGPGSGTTQQHNFKSGYTTYRPGKQAFPPPSQAEIRSALHAISPDCDRDTWARIGMAVKSGLGDSEGFVLFNAWSAGGEGYNATDTRDTWRSIQPGGGVSVKTLFGMARDAGWTWQSDRPFIRRAMAQPAGLPEQNNSSPGGQEPQPDFDATLARCVAANPDHWYLTKKGITAPGILQDGDRLVIPIQDESGDVAGLQFIGPDGGKRYQKGTRKKGNFHLVGCLWSELGDFLLEGRKLLICEGAATGATLHQATGNPAIVAFDAGNLAPVAATMRRLHPEADLIVCGDSDPNGAGQKAAQSAVLAAGGTMALPVFTDQELACLPGEKPPSDFNDLARLRGLGAVAVAVQAAVRPEPATSTPGTVKPAFIPQSGLDRDWLDTDPPDREMVVEGALPAGRVGALISPGGGFKSTIATSLAASVCAGVPWLEHFRVLLPGSVVFIGAEDENQEAHRRLKRIIRNWTPESQRLAMSRLFFESRVGLESLITKAEPFSREVVRTSFLDELLESLKLLQDLRLVILDPWARFKGGDENAAQDATRGVEAAEYLAKETGAAVLLLHHTSKGAVLNGLGDSQHSARGSSALVDGCRYVWNLSGFTTTEAKKYGIHENFRRDYVRLSNSKSNYCRLFDDVLLKMVNGIQKVDFTHQGKNSDPEGQAMAKVERIIETYWLKGIRFTRRSFVDTFAGANGDLGMSKAILDLLLKEAVAKGSLIAFQKKGQGGGNELYLPTESLPEDADHEAF